MTCIKNTRFIAREQQSKINIGEDFSMQGGCIQSVKPITIGCHCMFSGDIDILSSDLHPIYSLNDGQVINESEEIIINDHVWLGAHVRVLKGSCIAHDVIVGNSSLVCGYLESRNSIYAGIPAKFIKGDINWSRSWEGISLLS